MFTCTFRNEAVFLDTSSFVIDRELLRDFYRFHVLSVGHEDCQNVTTVDLHCAQSHWLVPILLAAYLIMGNVLMLNLLIAIMR